MNQIQEQETQKQHSVITINNKTIQKRSNYDPKQNYLLETRKIYLFNQTLQEQIELLKNENKQLEKQLVQPQKKQRRKDHEISKIYKCSQCEKTYGSEASLNLHSKIKHSISESESKTQQEQSFQI